MKIEDLKQNKINSLLRKVRLPYFKDKDFKYHKAIVDSFSKTEQEELGRIIANPLVFKFIETYKQFLADRMLIETKRDETIGFTYGAKHITSMINFWNEYFCPDRKKEREDKT